MAGEEAAVIISKETGVKHTRENDDLELCGKKSEMKHTRENDDPEQSAKKRKTEEGA